MKNIDSIIEHLSANYNFRYNQVSSRTEYKTVTEVDFKPLEDRDLYSILVSLNQSDIKTNSNDLRIIINSDLMPDFHPFLAYFDRLPKVEGTQNIEKLLATINTHDDTFFEWAFVKWLVAWVACMIDDSIINHQCVILAGKQGIGKSTWVENLMPKELLPYYYAGNIKLRNKDTLGLLADKSLINLDELASMTYSNVTELKELVTKSNITYRKPYGYFTEMFTRRASFIGSVNGTEFLYDLTGNRRFLSFEVESFTNFGFHGVNMDLVLAEAYNLYKSNFQFWFDAKDQIRVEKNNENFIVTSPEEIQILEYLSTEPIETEIIDDMERSEYGELTKYHREGSEDFTHKFKIIKKGLDKLRVAHIKSTFELFQWVTKKTPTQGELVKFGKILTKLGFKRHRSSKGTMYEVYYIKP